jgi:hypothetical protein
MEKVYNMHEKGGDMPALQIRNVPDQVYSRLRQQAKKHHRSLAGEVLHMLEAGLSEPAADGSDLFQRIWTVREKIADEYGRGASSAESVREDRDR